MTNFREKAAEYFVSVIQQDKLFNTAGRHCPHALAAAWSNFVKRESFFCNCVEKHQHVFWMRPDTEESGMMCVNCRGIVRFDASNKT